MNESLYDICVRDSESWWGKCLGTILVMIMYCLAPFLFFIAIIWIVDGSKYNGLVRTVHYIQTQGEEGSFDIGRKSTTDNMTFEEKKRFYEAYIKGENQ